MVPQLAERLRGSYSGGSTACFKYANPGREIKILGPAHNDAATWLVCKLGWLNEASVVGLIVHHNSKAIGRHAKLEPPDEIAA